MQWLTSLVMSQLVPTTHGKYSRNGRKIFEYSIFYTGTLTKSWGPKKHVYHFQFFMLNVWRHYKRQHYYVFNNF